MMPNEIAILIFMHSFISIAIGMGGATLFWKQNLDPLLGYLLFNILAIILSVVFLPAFFGG